jgi:hypothetical protein
MDPSVLLKQRSVRWDDPLDDYSKLQTLRQMMDQRRIREQQYQLQQQAMQEHVRKAQYEQEDRQRAMTIRELFAKNPNPSFQDIAAVDPATAIKLDTDRRLMQSAASQQAKAALDLQGERAKREANTYAAVTALPQDQQQDWWDTNVGGGLPVDRPPSALEEQAKYAEAYGGEALQKRRDAQEKAIRENALYAIDIPKHIAEAKTAQDKAEGKEPPTGNLAYFTKTWYPNWLDTNKLPKTATNEIAAYKEFQTLGQRSDVLSPEAEAQKIRMSQAGKSAADTSGLVDAVIQNPALYDNLTPTAKTAIGPKLVERGFTGFGKPLSEGAITKLSESRSAIASLKDLREVVKANEQYIGPIAGFAALNPYHPARKAQADIDRVRQRVGKALEGGVLRKEDEEKYKKILATLQDDPKTAIYKIDRLGEDLARDIEIFSNEQKAAGRRVESSAQPAQSSSVPKVGESFNGKKVTKVTKVQ